MTQPREFAMAGQPPEPSFQPAPQDQGLTQGRPAWQPPSYTPPGGSGGQQGPAAPSFSASGQDQAQSYPPQDQTYTSLGQGQGQYQGYQPPSYAQSGQGAAVPPPQWQTSAPAAQAAKPRQRAAGEKGFLGSLFDFSFTSLVTPKIIKVLYILFTIWTALIGLTILVIGFKTGGLAGGLFTLIIVEPIFVLLTLGIYRVVLELFMVVFRIYEETKKIRENTDSQA
jgi:Domain of unknown function (DUF4282)